MSDETTYYQRNTERLKERNWLKENYKNNKDKISDQAKNKYRGLSNEEKDIKREYGRNRYQKMS